MPFSISLQHDIHILFKCCPSVVDLKILQLLIKIAVFTLYLCITDDPVVTFFMRLAANLILQIIPLFQDFRILSLTQSCTPVFTRSGVGVHAKVNDASGSASFLLCILPQFNDRPKIEEIRNAVRERQMSE